MKSILAQSFFVWVIVAWQCCPVTAQLQKRYLFHPEQNYGSESQFSPFSVWINGSYDVLRNGGLGNDISNLSYSKGAANVPNNLAHPVKNIHQYNRESGHDFFSEQILPKDLNVERASWVPNYQSHFIGEGLITRELAEWYQMRGLPYPYVAAIFNVFAAQFMNEVIENNNYQGNNIDPIADIYIFNPLGWMLFAWDPAANFFANTLHFALWSPQPMLNPGNRNLSNAGEEYVIKVDMPGTETFQAFYCWGIDGNIGLTKKWNKDWNISLGFGRVAEQLQYQSLVDSRFVSAKLEPQLIFFLDRNNSLLFSFAQVGLYELNFRCNIYPGLFKSSRFGGFLGISPYTGTQIGLTYTLFPLGVYAGR